MHLNILKLYISIGIGKPSTYTVEITKSICEETTISALEKKQVGGGASHECSTREILCEDQGHQTQHGKTAVPQLCI